MSYDIAIRRLIFQAQSDIDHHRNRTERRSLAKDIKTTEIHTPCLALRVKVYYYYNATRHGPAVEAFMVLITTSLFQLYISSPPGSSDSHGLLSPNF